MLRIVLDIDTRADPIAGRLIGPEGDEHAFTGWMELARVLEEALRGSRERDSQPASAS